MFVLTYPEELCYYIINKSDLFIVFI